MSGSLFVGAVILLITFGGALLVWVNDLIAGDS